MKLNYITSILLLSALALAQGCSSANKKIKPIIKHEKLGNFDRVYIPNEASVISQMISIVQPELDQEVRNKIASDIFHAISKHPVEPQIVVALIDTESNFQYNKVSTTGDLSLGQVNADIWNIEFSRLKLPLIKKELLVSEDQSYAMEKMAQILSILKARHAKKDRRWYARYHSNTRKYKLDYLRKIEIRMKLLSKSRLSSSSNNLALSSSQISP